MKKNQPITYAFIDSQNLNLGVRNSGWLLDFRKFNHYLSRRYNVTKAYLFIGKIPGNQKLYKYLGNAGYILVFKPTIINSNKIKGNVDAELVLYTVDLQFTYNKAIIVSGDGDFLCLLDYLNSKNKLYKLFIPNKTGYSSLLKKYKNKMVFLNEIKQKVYR